MRIFHSLGRGVCAMNTTDKTLVTVLYVLALIVIFSLASQLV